MTDATPVPAPHPFADLVGLIMGERGEGRSISELEIAEEHLNPNNVVHGAVIFAMADTGMGSALTSVLDDRQMCSTIEIKINYFRPAISGRLRCDTRVINRGSRTAALESDVLDENQKLIARATGTYMILERP
jgi:acyl-CoA thioesterase